MTKIEAVRNFCRTAAAPFTVIDLIDAIPMPLHAASVRLSTAQKEGLIRRTNGRSKAGAAAHRKDGGYYLYERVETPQQDPTDQLMAEPTRSVEPKPPTRSAAPSLSLEDVGAAVMGHVERLERRIATLEGQAKDVATQARLRAAEHRRALDEKEQEKRRLADTIVELNGRIAALQVVRRPAVSVGRFFESA